MRGKEKDIFNAKSGSRITPACAGKSFCSVSEIRSTQDHPRVCGEKPISTIGIHSFSGSPPRVRGKDVSLKRILFSIRITPACAGKRLVMRLNRHNTLGSPPRVRGKVLHFADLCRRNGITPACAGKRLKRSHKIVLFISTPTHFHSVCNRPDITNNNLTALGASVLW